MEQADAQNPNVDTNHTNPAVAIANDEALEVLDEELSKLASKLQTAVVLCHIEGLTQQQAAKRLGVTASTVNDRLAKGRNALKVKLVQRGITLTLAGFSTYIASTSKALAAVSSSPVADTTARAALYAAGHSASDIGVSNLVFNEANRVIATMTTTKIASVFLTVLAILFLGGPIAAVVGMNGFGNARAGTFFLDTFDDMNINDEAPFSWTADGGGTILDATSGDLVISQPLAGEGSFAVIDNYAYDDVSVRSLVGVAGDTFREVGVGVRGIVGNSAIYASISGTGAAFGAAAPKSLVIYRIRGGSPPVILTQVPTNLDPTSMDVWLQLDASGDDLKFSAWADGIPKTSISAQDSIQSGDVVGIIYNGAESATFRSFETLPEPSGASLSILGLLVATSWFRISRR